MSAMLSSSSGDPQISSLRVYRGIMKDLEEGRLVPGQVLAETNLATHYGVGRNAVREAMQQLAARGVVDLSRYRSPTIRRLDLDETLEILAVASAMTALAAQAAASQYDPARHAGLVASTLAGLAQADADDETGMFSRARRYFYRALLQVGGNRELMRLYPSISMHVIYAQYQSRLLRGIRLADYREIMDAVARGDLTASDTAARNHVDHVRAAIEHIHGLKR